MPEGGPPRLADLLRGIARYQLRGDGATRVGSLAPSSRDAQPGALYFSVPSPNRLAAVAAAVRCGASAIVTDRWMPAEVVQVKVPSVVRSIGPIASEFFGRPHERMTMIGVTGTNGKSTVVHLLHAIFAAAGVADATIGTTGAWVGARPVAAGDLTTPEAVDLQALLARLASEGVQSVAMEVTSHALAQYRVDGVRFASSIFTNLSPAHLDFHGDSNAYFEAKARLFTPEKTELGVVNVDASKGRELAGRVPCLTYGTASGADLLAEGVEADASGVRFRLGGRWVRTRLRGRFNVHNCLAAIGAASSVGIDRDVAARAVESVEGLPGRMEVFTTPGGVRVVHDAFNANPASLAAGVEAARALATDGRLAVILGTMAELGARSASEYIRAGRTVARLGADRLVTVGSDAQVAAEAVGDHGSSTTFASCLGISEALDDLARWARAGDTVYVKGSRVAGLEAIAAALR